MESVYTALSISLITNKRLAVCCDNAVESTNHFIDRILQPCGFNQSQYIVIDLLKHKSIEDILHHATIEVNNGLQFRSIIIWQNLQHLDHIRQKQLYNLLLQMDNYGKHSSRTKENLPTTIKCDGIVFEVVKPCYSLSSHSWSLTFTIRKYIHI